MKFRFIHAPLLTVTAVAALGIGLASAPLASTAASAAPASRSSASRPAASPSAASSAVKVPVFTLPLTEVGQINLSAAAAAEHRAHVATRRQGAAIARAAAARAKYREVDNAIHRHAIKGKVKTGIRPRSIPLTTHNVKGESGFSALGGVQQAGTTGGVDLEPPDQGLCAGGGYVMEFINNALAIYDKNGDQLVAPIGSATAFRQPTSDFFSDPRCYYDAATQRWFFQEFIVGSFSSSGQLVTPSTQFEAVSTGPDPTGTYTIYSWNTSDSSTKGCPCFGDYDQLGADGNGIYVATDEFGINTPAYNGAVIYAISKEQLETAATTGIVPPVFGYRLTSDPFGQPYIVAPTSTPPGAKFATNTEYFVESDSNQPTDQHLLVYALHDTSELGTPAAPAMYRTEVATESYAFPPDAKQKAGVRPLGNSYQDPAGGIQADFNAEMEPVYTAGRIYAQLDTATASGSDAVDWFILTPALSGSTLSAKVDDQGVVSVADTSLLYPYTAVNAQGHGYLLFSMSGPHTYPSPGYIAYGSTGPDGSVMQATPGAAPNDGFTCYAAFVGPNYGGCRWGDYSQGVVMNGRVYMAAEMIPQGYRDLLSNWGTYIWSAPPPNS